MINRLKAKEISEARALLLAADPICPLCDTDLRTLPLKDVCLDHCHDNGWIRGLLCRNCNAMDGRVRHYANRAKRNRTALRWLKRLVAYWEKHRTNQHGIFHPAYRTQNEKKALRNKRARKRRLQKRANASTKKSATGHKPEK